MDAWLLLVGFVAGVVSGLLGVGGGIVLTPFLHYIVGRSWVDAVGLSLWVIALQSPVGVWRHARQGVVDWRLAGWLALGGLFGVYLGDRALPFLPVPLLKLLFACLMVFAAWRLGRSLAALGHLSTPALLGLGLAAGVISRILGVGGGILTVPSLSLLGVPVHVAVGSSLVPVFSNAAVASAANLARGLVWLDGLWLAAGAMVGTFVGVWVAHGLPAARLQRVVAVALVMVAALVAWDALRNLL